MTDWTDADVELVARALADACPTPDQCADYHDECLQQHGVHWTAVGPGGVGPQYITVLEGDPRTLSRIALSALAAAGRDYTAGVAEGRRHAAEEFAAACAAEYDQLARTAIRCHQTGDHAEARIVAARQRTWRAASDLAMQIAEEGRTDDR